MNAASLLSKADNSSGNDIPSCKLEVYTMTSGATGLKASFIFQITVKQKLK